MIGQALGGKTFKLKFGHHGGNHPLRHTPTGACARREWRQLACFCKGAVAVSYGTPTAAASRAVTLHSLALCCRPHRDLGTEPQLCCGPHHAPRRGRGALCLPCCACCGPLHVPGSQRWAHTAQIARPGQKVVQGASPVPCCTPARTLIPPRCPHFDTSSAACTLKLPPLLPLCNTL